ncbi:MAG: hypothetical protein ABR970_20470, partial [Roseiarcus sp.]
LAERRLQIRVGGGPGDSKDFVEIALCHGSSNPKDSARSESFTYVEVAPGASIAWGVRASGPLAVGERA